ncbi:FAD-binding oxidoreductase [Roseomonas sp. SSH11]|uniref:FAD-binding oxidoreductase n=1 Tax=Pararoseomonas baculiformis TaxID=2820812 RepID=A0ABS4ABV2_9PROT|nr:FAD-binding oxidoreductase [Pararoseomonas baculiformis]MBP0444485.1 FAD-binding oxidoreductase [Pararoseomonas baculiformis]
MSLAVAENTALVAELAALLGRQYVTAPDEDQEPYVVDWRGRYHGRAAAVVKPASTAEVAEVVKLCARHGVALVPQGGNTGMCGAATPDASGRAVVLRLDRLNRIRAVSALANSITVEAGCILQTIQEAAAGVDRLFPLSLGAEGSCQIGGNIATNAGGTAVLRYGNTRELVLGLEVVLPDGSVLNRLQGLRKNSSGYDLKQLFIGAEGTLGIITAASLKLFPRPRASALAMVALPEIEAALTLMGRLRDMVGDRLASLEAMSRGQIEVIAEHVPDVSIPFALEAPWYLLIELTDTLAGTDLRTPLEEVLGAAFEEGLVTDAVIAESQAQAHALWKIRHSVSEGSKRAGYVVSHDSVVPLENQALFARKVERRILEQVPDARVVMHGHIGDGNIHVLAILDAARFPDATAAAPVALRINTVVDDETAALGGVISAEHGIGISNRARLGRVTDPAEIALMRRVKALLDPAGMMNPGKVLPPEA